MRDFPDQERIECRHRHRWSVTDRKGIKARTARSAAPRVDTLCFSRLARRFWEDAFMTAAFYSGALEVKTDFGNQFVVCHGLRMRYSANCAQLSSLFDVSPQARVLPEEPFFHQVLGTCLYNSFFVSYWCPISAE